MFLSVATRARKPPLFWMPPAPINPQASNLLAVRVLKPGDKPIDGYVLKEIPHRNEVVDYAPGNSFDTVE